MRTAQELLQEWRNNKNLRAEWSAVIHTAVFRHLCELVSAISLEKAEQWQRHEPDPVLARNLAEQKGARSVIRFLERACDEEVKVEAQIEEPFGHVADDYILTRNQNTNQD